SLTWLVEQGTMVLRKAKDPDHPFSDTVVQNALAAVFGQLGTLAPDSFLPQGLLKQGLAVGDSDDPNGVRGPPSSVAVPGDWVSGELALGYSVHFENKATAAYPAQYVRVVDNLDPVALDMSTLSLGPIAVPGGSKQPTPGISPV